MDAQPGITKEDGATRDDNTDTTAQPLNPDHPPDPAHPVEKPEALAVDEPSQGTADEPSADVAKDEAEGPQSGDVLMKGNADGQGAVGGQEEDETGKADVAEQQKGPDEAAVAEQVEVDEAAVAEQQAGADEAAVVEQQKGSDETAIVEQRGEANEAAVAEQQCIADLENEGKENVPAEGTVERQKSTNSVSSPRGDGTAPSTSKRPSFRGVTGNRASSSTLSPDTNDTTQAKTDYGLGLSGVSAPDTEISINEAATRVLKSLAVAEKILEENLLQCKDGATRQMLEEKRHSLLGQMDNMRTLLQKEIVTDTATTLPPRINGLMNSSVDASQFENREVKEMVQSLEDIAPDTNADRDDIAESVITSVPSCVSPCAESRSHSVSSNLTATVRNLQRVRRQVDAAATGQDMKKKTEEDDDHTWYPVEQAEKDLPELRRVRRQIRYLFSGAFDDLSDFCLTPRPVNSPPWDPIARAPFHENEGTQVAAPLPPVKKAASPRSKASDRKSVSSHMSSSYVSESISEVSRPSGKEKKRRQKHHRHRHVRDSDDRDWETSKAKEHDSRPLPRNWADEVVKASVAPQNRWYFDKDELPNRSRARWEQPRQKSTPADIVQKARERANEVLRAEGYR